ncbi:MAG: SDR family oxidoreductase, partial [Paracoccaceae bacterium]
MRVLPRFCGTAVFQYCDVGKSEDVQAAVQCAVSKYGTLDILVNNAAVAIPGSV